MEFVKHQTKASLLSCVAILSQYSFQVPTRFAYQPNFSQCKVTLLDWLVTSPATTSRVSVIRLFGPQAATMVLSFDSVPATNSRIVAPISGRLSTSCIPRSAVDEDGLESADTAFSGSALERDGD
jgi:hypothetical protein